MIFRTLLLLCFLGLAGCGGGGGSSSVEEGTSVTFTAQAVPNSVITPTADGKSFYNRDGVKITLKKAYLTIWSVALNSDCSNPSFSRWGEKMLAWLINDSQAHAVSAPTQLGVPSAINLLDDKEFLLGKINPPPASYCGTEINFLKADADTQYLPQNFSMLNRSLYVEGEFIPVGSTQAIPFTFDTAKALLPRLLRAPVTLSSTQRTATLKFTLAYDTWFDGLDLRVLSSDETQQNLLFYNVVQSVRRLL